jgi:HlyD family secretion protein
VDLSDVYMTFFLPETVAGKLALGSEVRIVLDAAPQYVIPAGVLRGQHRPVHPQDGGDRQRAAEADVPRQGADRSGAAAQHLTLVKTGLPGVAWVRTDNARGPPRWR